MNLHTNEVIDNKGLNHFIGGEENKHINNLDYIGALVNIVSNKAYRLSGMGKGSSNYSNLEKELENRLSDLIFS